MYNKIEEFVKDKLIVIRPAYAYVRHPILRSFLLTFCTDGPL
jgi:hypothetical protein